MAEQEQEASLREIADRSTLLLLESPQNLGDLIRLLAADLADRLDFAQAERINRSFIDPDLNKREADLLFRVPYREGRSEVWVYVLLEHQFRVDRTMPLRLLSYMVQIWEAQARRWKDERLSAAKRKLAPILPVVFYTGRRKWSKPNRLKALMEAPPGLEAFAPEFDILWLPLQETPATTLAQQGTALAWSLRAAQAIDEPLELLKQALQEAAIGLERLPKEMDAEWERAIRYIQLLLWHKRAEEEQAELFQIVSESIVERKEDVKEIEMTGAQALIETGRKEGRQEGRQEELQESRETLRLLLTKTFGELPQTTKEKIERLSSKQVHALLRQLPAAESLQDLDL